MQLLSHYNIVSHKTGEILCLQFFLAYTVWQTKAPCSSFSCYLFSFVVDPGPFRCLELISVLVLELLKNMPCVSQGLTNHKSCTLLVVTFVVLYALSVLFVKSMPFVSQHCFCFTSYIDIVVDAYYLLNMYIHVSVVFTCHVLCLFANSGKDWRPGEETRQEIIWVRGVHPQHQGLPPIIAQGASQRRPWANTCRQHQNTTTSASQIVCHGFVLFCFVRFIFKNNVTCIQIKQENCFS